ncbi:unnamed protein product [Heterobilharzia americana]|nr:unnamed protein product [Heterobilharzia americana]
MTSLNNFSCKRRGHQAQVTSWITLCDADCDNEHWKVNLWKMFWLFIFSYINKNVIVPVIHYKSDCIGLNADCSKTVFVQCCDPLSCELDSPFNGKCKLCLSAGSFCWRSSECCSKTCSWFKCTDPVKDLVKQITG